MNLLYDSQIVTASSLFWSRLLLIVNKSIKTGYTKMAQWNRHSSCLSGGRKVILSDSLDLHCMYAERLLNNYRLPVKRFHTWKQTLSETHEGPCCVARFPCFPRHYFPLGPRADQVCRVNSELCVTCAEVISKIQCWKYCQAQGSIQAIDRNKILFHVHMRNLKTLSTQNV